ncbi:hypothetical protein VTL71DRAFT_3510 [Oculimacula yallundae]|uniref:Zn(2)-C6 fungal-type domain-containing protein n=1 Tax=Oculimacula yallundae TaxID=86028 RepID=A0ABR4C7F0_9HELO
MADPHDPSDPNDPRNWNGHPGPTFTAVDPFDVQRNTVLYSSFTLLAIPAHLLPPQKASILSSAEISNPTSQQNQVSLAPTEELESRLAGLDPELPIPAGLRTNIDLAALDRQVRSQIPDKLSAPKAGHLLREFRRNNALNSFHQKHIQLLPDITRYIENGGDASNVFTSRPELNELAQQIVSFVRKGRKEIYSSQVELEVELRIREGSSQDITDNNIHQLQLLSSQLYRLEASGNVNVPEEISNDLLYQQIQAYLVGIKRGTNHAGVRADLKRRITKLRSQRSIELKSASRSGESSRAASQAPEISRTTRPIPRSAPPFTPEDTSDFTSRQTSQVDDDTPVVRDDVLNYGMQPESAAGLPTGFAFDPGWIYGGRASVTGNVETLRYYVNDGPQGPQETEIQYLRRMKRAVENMGLEKRVIPILSQQVASNFGNDKNGVKKARSELKNKTVRDSNAHATALQGSMYKARWVAEKRARQARNAVRRREAQERLRAELASRPESLGLRLPTPPPPDDSGDELYDFSIAGPRVGDTRELRLQKDSERRKGKVRKRNKPRPYPEDLPLETGSKCTGCSVASVDCSMAQTGRPCNRCQSLGIHCLGRDEEVRYTSINRRASLPLLEEEAGPDAALGTDPRFVNARGRTKFKRMSRNTFKARDRRSRSPLGENDFDFGHSDFTPCENCILYGRSCDGNGPPCTPCALYGVESTCDLNGLSSQPYQPQSPMMSYSPAQLGTVPYTGGPADDPWSRLNALLDEGVPLTSGAELHPFQEIPPTPQGPIDWNETDALLGFTSETANPSTEMEAQSMNWVSSEPAIPLGELQYNGFGQELDMHGEVIPNRRIQKDVILSEGDPDFPVNSIENNYSSGSAFNTNTNAEYDQFAVNNYFDPNVDPDEDFFSLINEMNDTAMGGTSDEPLNPHLPNDSLSFGQDPSRQPDYTIPGSPVLPDIDPQSTLQGIPTQNSEPCDEDPEYFTSWTGATCSNVPTKACDHTSHIHPHAICIPCHASQNAAFSSTQDDVISSTKRYMCTPCSTTARYMQQVDAPVNPEKDPDNKVLLGMCLCTLQMRKTWLCHLHRDQAVTRVKARVAIMQDVVVRMSGLEGVKCPFCSEREQDVGSGAWACVACYKYVIER